MRTAELARALCHGRGNHATDAGKRHEQRQRGEDAEQRGRDPWRRERGIAEIVEGLYRLDRLIRIDRVHGVTQRSRKAAWIAVGANQDAAGKPCGVCASGR